MRFHAFILAALIALVCCVQFAQANGDAHPPVQVLSDGSQVIQLNTGSEAVTIKGRRNIGRLIAQGRYAGYKTPDGKLIKPARIENGAPAVQFNGAYHTMPLLVKDPANPDSAAIKLYKTPSSSYPDPPKPSKGFAPVYVDDVAALNAPKNLKRPVIETAAASDIPQGRSMMEQSSAVNMEALAAANAQARAQAAAAAAAEARAQLAQAQLLKTQLGSLLSHNSQVASDIAREQNQAEQLQQVNRQRELSLDEMELKIRTHAAALAELSSRHSAVFHNAHEQQLLDTSDLAAAKSTIMRLNSVVEQLLSKSKADDERIAVLQKTLNAKGLRTKAPTIDEVRAVVKKQIVDFNPTSTLKHIETTASHVKELLNTLERKSHALGAAHPSSERLNRFAQLFNAASAQLREVSSRVAETEHAVLNEISSERAAQSVLSEHVNLFDAPKEQPKANAEEWEWEYA